jgi:hypothetical protein
MGLRRITTDIQQEPFMFSIRANRSLLVMIAMLVISAASLAQVGISIIIGPPPLPVYEQPVCPGDGFIWTPGYWAYGEYGYYWIPGTWILAPTVGYLWTPPWWGWEGGRFFFHEGYWGPHVGFYGGINYGYGYFGHGFEGGRWDNGRFFYNRSVTNVNVTRITNVYNTTVVNNNRTTVNRVSYNGGEGGINARATAEEEAAARDSHLKPTSVQEHHAQAAFTNPELRDSVNHGRPTIAATPKAGAFNAAVPAKEAGGTYKPANDVPRPPNAAVHASDVRSVPRPTPPKTGNTQLDQKYQQQQDKLYAKQQQDHEQLQRQQEQDHQRLEQQHASDAQKQQMEQRHQQQTQQMEQRHTQEAQHLQERQQSSARGGPSRR